MSAFVPNFPPPGSSTSLRSLKPQVSSSSFINTISLPTTCSKATSRRPLSHVLRAVSTPDSTTKTTSSSSSLATTTSTSSSSSSTPDYILETSSELDVSNPAVVFKGRTGIILTNIGTPASPNVKDVRAYLREFLGDNRVVDINPIVKFFLLNFIVLPFRSPKSAEAYKEIWDEQRGSPLQYHTEDLIVKLEKKLGDKYLVRIGNQFGAPNMKSALTELAQAGVDRVVVVPMFPQFTSSTSGSANELAYKLAGQEYATPFLHVIPPFYDHKGYIDAYADIINQHIRNNVPLSSAPAIPMDIDHVLMSFHGVPETHCSKTDATGMYCQKVDACCSKIVQANRNCYRAQCFESARQIAQAAKLPQGKWSVAFQSRLDAAGPKWIQPYTDASIVQLAKKGVKKLAVVVPSFTADCLETIEEIGMEGKQEFLENGGEHFVLIPCINSTDRWAQGLVEIMKDSCPMGTF